MEAPTIHHGRNIKRIREILGIKQETLAIDLGDDWNQQKISLLEQKAEIEPKLLGQIAKILGVVPDTIKGYSEDDTLQYITNNYNEKVENAITNGRENYFTFNPIDKIVELYERLLSSEKEKAELAQGKK